jgi:hypothetical protein
MHVHILHLDNCGIECIEDWMHMACRCLKMAALSASCQLVRRDCGDLYHLRDDFG